MSQYLSGQGLVYQAQRDINGNPVNFVALGNVPLFDLALTVTTVEHKESTSGFRVVDLRLVTEKKAELTLNVQEFLPTNYALLMHGNVNSLGAGSVTSEQLGGGVTGPFTVGEIFGLKNVDVTSLVLTDSAGGPATLALGTDYSVNLRYGLITTLNNWFAFTAPIKAAYTKTTGQKSVDILTTPPPSRYLRFLAVNTAALNVDGSYKRFVLDLYNVTFDPAAQVSLIGDTVSDGSLKGSALVDPFKSITAAGGAIGQLIYVD